MAVKQIETDGVTYKISYDIENLDQKKDIAFLHGWGSNKEIMKKAFKDRFSGYRVIFVDMPGFGSSINNEELTTEKYAQIMRVFLSKLEFDHLAIVGHSFGGKVATLLSPKHLILLSSSGIVREKSLIVRFKITLAKLFKSFGLAFLTKKLRSKDVTLMSENMYKTFKNVVDEDFSPYFKSFNNKALIFWGKNDTTTPVDMGEEISKQIKNSEFYPLEGDHYFFLQNAEFISKTIKEDLCKSL